MAIPPGSLIAQYDVSNPSSYSGTGNTLYDLTASNFDMTLSNTTYNSTTNYDSLVFNAASPSYANYNGSLGVPTGPPVFTFFMWIKTTSFTASAFNIFFSYGRDGNPSIGGIPLICSRTNSSNVAYTEFGSAKAPIAPGTPTVVGEWTNYCITSDGTTYKFYIDGALVGSAALSGSDIWTLPQLTIGAFNSIPDFPCNLEFNYLEAYDSALSAGDITTLYNQTVTRFAPTPISELDFSDLACYPGSGTTVFDLVSNNDFSITSGATFVSDGQASYFQFAGSGNRLQTISPVTVTSQTVFTFSAWAMNTGTTSIGILFASGQNNPSGGVPCIAINVTAPDVVISTYGFGVGTAVGTAINENEWYLLTMTCDGTTNKIYINDTLAGSGSRSTGSIFNNPTDLVIGQYSTTDLTTPWIGRVATYSYYDEALSLEDIQNLYNSTVNRFSTPNVSIVGGRQFNQGFNG